MEALRLPLGSKEWGDPLLGRSPSMRVSSLCWGKSQVHLSQGEGPAPSSGDKTSLWGTLQNHL